MYQKLGRIHLFYLFDSLSLGGTERVLINRAHAAMRQGFPLSIDFHVPNASEKEILDFECSIRALGLFNLNFVRSIEDRAYTAIVLIDFPSMLDRFANAGVPVIVEAHQSRLVLQQYLTDLPGFVQQVVVPSLSHAQFVKALLPDHVTLRIIPNVVTPLPHRAGELWKSDPIVLYCGRMGALKNTPLLMEVFASILQVRADIRPMVVTPTPRHELTDDALNRLGLRERVSIRRSVPFSEMGSVYESVRVSGGVFLSCSLAESFGLAAAEAMCAGVPAILSDIVAHRALLADNDAFLFPIADPAAAAARVLDALADVPKARARQAPAAAALSDERSMLDALHRVFGAA